MGTATAGAMIEALEVEEFEGVGVGVEEGDEAEVAAMMLGFEVVKVVEPPSDLVMMEVRRIMLVESWESWLFWSAEVVLVEVSEVVVSGDDVDDVDEEDVGGMVVTKAAGSEKLSLVVEEVVVEIEVDEELVEAAAELEEGLGCALPTEETTTPLLSPKRSVDVLQQPRLLSPAASGRFASQQ